MRTKVIQFDSQSSSLKHQAGVTLMEMLIGLALSVVVTSSMVILMGNSLGTATRIIHSSQLTDELRNSMSMITRDLRRANYSATSIFCYGNSNCGAKDGVSEQAGDISIVDADGDGIDDDNCFIFALDRNHDGDAANDPRAGFRRVVDNNVGVIEMFTGGVDAKCDTDNGWIALTDPATVNISEFTINQDLSFSRVIEENETSSFTNRQRQIQIQLEGQLVLEEAAGIDMVSRRMEDIIYVRNDFIIL